MARDPTRSSLLRSEDWLSVWLGFLVVLLVLVGLPVQSPGFKWATTREFESSAARHLASVRGLAAAAAAKNAAALASAAGGLEQALVERDRAAVATAARALAHVAGETVNVELGRQAAAIAKAAGGVAGAHVGEVLSGRNVARSIVIALGFMVVAAAGVGLMGGNLRAFVVGFPLVYLLAWLALFVAGNASVGYWGLEFVIWALAIGLIIGNVLGVPPWLSEAIRTEYYIKTGLVILGAGIVFAEILQAGALGLVQAVSVVLVVWYACFWLARRLRVDDEFAVMLSTAVSICGVSAAIAACGAIQGDRKKLSYVTSLVLIVAVPMMVFEPWIAKAWGLPDLVAGAWLGGTLDTSGSVVAAGALISETALKAGVIVKFSQNVLIGVAAFVLSVWWTLRSGEPGTERPSARVIWERFPKFVLGFLVASFVFSFLLDPTTVSETKDTLAGLRTVWFALAFVCIGLETRLTELVGMESGRPALAFVGAQAFNVVWTLVLAYVLFGGVLFPVPQVQ